MTETPDNPEAGGDEEEIDANIERVKKRGPKKYQPNPQAPAAPVSRNDGTMNPLLYDLLHLGMPSHYEEPIREVLEKQFREIDGITMERDEVGNLFVRVPHADDPKKPVETMFSAHMDTVHRRPTKVVPMVSAQQVPDGRVRRFIFGATNGTPFPELTQWRFRGKNAAKKNRKTAQQAKQSFVDRIMRIKGDPVYRRSVLGADDKVGCYIMAQLIENKTPGLYAFHIAEEIGGVGSNWVAANQPERVTGIKRCIAFDRMDYGDVVTEQALGECASPEFGDGLADALNKGLGEKVYRGGVSGIFTDSAFYGGLIPECTNLSVGYFRQHGPLESFDLDWLEDKLIPALKGLDWDGLPTVRVPDPETYGQEPEYEDDGADMDALIAALDEMSPDQGTPPVDSSEDAPKADGPDQPKV
ncbi:MAG: hypothetical protein Alpg2KO_03460 [Alphaproteobacteria bacterium]